MERKCIIQQELYPQSIIIIIMMMMMMMGPKMVRWMCLSSSCGLTNLNLVL